MGSSLSLQLVDCQEIRDHQWDQVHFKQRNFGKWRTLKNRRTGAMLDQYQVSWQTKHEYSFYIKSFNWRNRRCNQSPIVLSVSLKQTGKGDICTEKYTANIYLEHIPLRLSQIQDIPISQSLFILLQSLEGYSQLYQHSGYFKIYQEQICIDRSGKVKVWVNADLSKNYPDCDTDCGRSKMDQIDMVEQLLEIITQSTDTQQMPSPSLLQYFDMVRRRQVLSVGFQYAKIIVLQFARVYQIRIPNRFQTIMQIITPNLNIHKNYSTNIQTLPSSIEFIHRQPPRLQHTNSMPQFSPTTVYPSYRNELKYSQPLSQGVNYNSQINFPYIGETNQSQYMQQIPYNLNLQQINLNRQQSQQTKRKSGNNSNNSKKSKNSKSQIIILEDNSQNQSITLNEGNTDRNTMRSMPNYNIQLTNNRFGSQMEQIRHSQYLIGSVQQERGFGRKANLNKDSFGMVIPRRRVMKESNSSNNFASNSSSQSRKYPNSNELSKNSEQSSQNKLIEQFKQIVLQAQKRQCGSEQYLRKQCELDPEIEADIRRYLGQ